MKSRDRAHAETEEALRWFLRGPWLFVAVAVALIIGTSAGVYSIVNANTTSQIRKLEDDNRKLAEKAQQTADSAAKQARANCQLDKLVAEAPLQTPTSPFALNASVGARSAYMIAQCDGPLAPADPRVAALLPLGVH